MDPCDSMLKYPDNTSTHVIRDNWGQAIAEVMAEDICMQRMVMLPWLGFSPSRQITHALAQSSVPGHASHHKHQC